MQKIKILTALTSCWMFGFVFTDPVLALVPTISIQGLPSYINTDNFKLSCSSLGGTNVQFAYRKEGDSYQNFADLINITSNPCQVQVTGNQIKEQTKYYFKVTLDGGVSDETSVIFDNSGPSPVSGYYRDLLGTETKLHWRNPDNTDFDGVYIYRGETVDFSADSSHEIARVYGSPNSDMTYGTDNFSNKTYFYSIRAVDKAGNSSGLVGDGSTSTSSTVVTQTQPQNASGSVRQLSKEPVGQVLGQEEVESEQKDQVVKENQSVVQKIINKVPMNKYFYFGGGLIALAIILSLIVKRYKNK